MERAKESQGVSDQSVKDFKTGADQSWIYIYIYTVSQQKLEDVAIFFPNIFLAIYVGRMSDDTHPFLPFQQKSWTSKAAHLSHEESSELLKR